MVQASGLAAARALEQGRNPPVQQYKVGKFFTITSLRNIFGQVLRCVLYNLPEFSQRDWTQRQKRMLPFKSKEPRRTHWRTGALNHAIPRGSVWHNVETMGGRRSRYWCGPDLEATGDVVRSTYRRTS